MDVVKYVDYGYKSILYIKVYNNNNIQKNIDKQSVLSYVIYKYIYIYYLLKWRIETTNKNFLKISKKKNN